MILITGGTGFVGSHLVEKLLAEGLAVRCLVRSTSNTRKLPAGVETVLADLASGKGVDAALQGVSAVLHLAGVTKALTPSDYYVGNASATETLAKAVHGRAIRFVHVSSLAAAGPSLDGRPLTEDVEPHPVSTYGRSKLEGELAVRHWLPDAVIVRPPVVYGPRDTDVFQLLQSISRGLVLEIAGGERWFSAIYVEDLVAGILAAWRAPAATGNCYFLSHAKAASWQELGRTAAQIMGRSPRTLRVPVRAARMVGYFAENWSRITRNPAIISREKIAEACCRYWTCDPARATADFGFEAPTPLALGLAKSLAWYKEAGWLKY